MTAERRLAWLLRGQGVVLLCALPAVVLPTEWMAAVHRSLGLGDMPRGVLVEYLTRSISLLYGAWGAPVLLFVAADVRRYLPLIRLLAWLQVGIAAGLLVLDVWVGMPAVWVVCEAPVILALSGLTLLFARQIPPEGV